MQISDKELLEQTTHHASCSMDVLTRFHGHAGPVQHVLKPDCRSTIASDVHTAGKPLQKASHDEKSSQSAPCRQRSRSKIKHQTAQPAALATNKACSVCRYVHRCTARTQQCTETVAPAEAESTIAQVLGAAKQHEDALQQPVHIAEKAPEVNTSASDRAKPAVDTQLAL
jgi:hypothetical protein